jgi:hypothetical protein
MQFDDTYTELQYTKDWTTPDHRVVSREAGGICFLGQSPKGRTPRKATAR